jgi:hypothetical protein
MQLDHDKRRTLLAQIREANLRYLSEWAWAAIAHVRLLTSLVRQAYDESTPSTQSLRNPPSPPPPSLVIEAEAGTQGRGVFLIENTGPQPVRGTIEISDFADTDGNVAHLSILLDPREIALNAGEELLVHVQVNMDDRLPVNVRYFGRFSVPGLSAAPVEAVVKRRPSPIRHTGDPTGQESVNKPSIRKSASAKQRRGKRPKAE